MNDKQLYVDMIGLQALVPMHWIVSNPKFFISKTDMAKEWPT